MKSTMVKVIGSLVGGLAVFLISAYVFQYAMGTTEAKMSIEEIESLASERFPGEVVEVEYDDNTYEIEIKMDTQSFELVLDATTGEILYLEEKNHSVATANDREQADQPKQEATADQSGEVTTTDEEQVDTSTDSDPASESDSSTVDGTTDDSKEPVSEQEESKGDEELSSNQSIPNENASDVAKETVANTPAVMINRGQAQKIAREKANNAKVTEIELEEDDGMTYYQVELENDTHEFEVEIDAFTGKVLIIEMEQRDDQTTAKSQVMSRDAVRQLLTKNYADYRIEKIELDNDDGRMVYDIELKAGRVEIEMALDAVSGDVLDFDKEVDDEDDRDDD
ncbi:hypothetical protein HMI01_05950 [Halolactibacillus miurensis]|uniref:Uncharacterized membrane protein YkoI n=1 Tax=Halolactibacillus miurensis TaxID=306541 RepID=A0A1I6R3C0_9BACI|nr:MULTISPECIES: PepSY domain-containing protein [Halolactibacillus]GEM03607.1 hypothetical protein HMI01_05950 [Halolactibacillus miurensis]SFS59222.1 Uncharacterized membrane protein YkoI [Halolactibacillus miurensis]